MAAQNIYYNIFFLVVAAVIYFLSLTKAPISSSNKAPVNISLVLSRAQSLAHGSWEYGTIAEALLEFDNPSLSVFGTDPFPHDRHPVADVSTVPSLEYAKPLIYLSGPELQQNSGAVGDPPSLGVSALLIGQSSPEYLHAAERQLDFLLNKAPRLDSGAISHRVDVAELWADFVYMAPPFIAYLAVMKHDIDLMKEAFKQIRLYWEGMVVNATESHHSVPEQCIGCWRHIVGAKHAYLGIWSTSNGWAAAGMARVLATMRAWGPSAHSMFTEQDSLATYIETLLDAVMAIDTASDPQPSPSTYASTLLPNYLASEYHPGDSSHEPWFHEGAGTALLAATAYRMRAMLPDTFGDKYEAWADAKYAAVMEHIDSRSGILAPVVYSRRHADRTPFMSGTAEAQAFVALLEAARRDCLSMGRCGSHGMRERFMNWMRRPMRLWW